MRRDTLLDFFDDLAALRGTFLAYDNGFRRWSFSYAEVSRAALAFGARLTEAGLTKGDAVIFWSENRPEWIAALWGCWLQGVVAVPIDYRASPDFLRRVAGIVGARLVLAGDEVDHGQAGPTSVWPLSEFDWHATGQAARAAVTRDDTAEIIFTSGATAEPKGVVITHRNILANIVPVEHEIVKYRKYARPFAPIRFLNLLPLSHMFGQSMATFIPPLLSGTVVFMRGFNPHDIVRQIKSRRVSVLVSVPKILDVLREHVLRAAPESAEPPPGKEHFTRRWWRYRRAHRLFGLKFWSFVVGAAPLDPSLEEFWGRLGFVVIQGYGLTETAPIVSLNHPFSTSKGSVGKAIAGVEVKIAEDGEILVRGDNVTKGYFGAAEATAEAFEGGWFHTGDIGEVDADGRIFIKGRKKEMIVTPEGLNVFPEDVERVVAALPGVRDVAVVGVRSGAEERVHAVVVTEPGVDPQSLVRQANLALLDHQKIRGISAWPTGELPRTEGTRKLKRQQVRDWVASGGTGRHHDRARVGRRGAAGAVHRRPPRRRRHHARRAGSQLAGTRRADGRARRAVWPDHRRERIRQSHRHRRAGATGARRASHRGVRRAVIGRAGGLPVVEPDVVGACRAPHELHDVASAAGATVCLGQGRWRRAPRRHRGAGHLRGQPPEPHGHPRHSLGAARALAVPRRGGDGQGILQSALLP